MSQAKRDHVKEYVRSLTIWRAKNLSDKICHDCAAASAKEKFRLEPDEQKAVDELLDGKYPERLKKDPADHSDAPHFDVPTVQ